MQKDEVEDTIRAPGGWDMSQERLLTEQLVGQRFNFFLVFFSMVVAGAVNAKAQSHLQLVLTIGTCVTVVLTQALHRTSRRLDTILAILREDPTHPYTIVSARVGGRGVRKTLWRSLPTFCTACIGLAAILSWSGCLRVAPTASSEAVVHGTSGGSR